MKINVKQHFQQITYGVFFYVRIVILS